MTVIFILAILVFLPNTTRAARIVFEPVATLEGNAVKVLLAPEGSDINAIQGEVVLENMLEGEVSVKISDSIVPFWTDPPAIKDGVIYFSGVLPGGFEGLLLPDTVGAKPGLLFSIDFAAQAKNRTRVVSRNTVAYLNDGHGTALNLPLSRIDFDPLPLEASEDADTAPPAPFRLYVSRDSSLFDGRWFVAWSTLDRDSGIDHFEIREARPGEDGKWIAAESPYELRDQELKSAVDVKAIDLAGNERIAHLDPQNRLTIKDWLRRNDILIILGILALAILGYAVRRI